MGLPFHVWVSSGWRRGMLLGLAMLLAAHVSQGWGAFDPGGVAWTNRLIFGLVMGLVAPFASLLMMAIFCTIPRYLGLGRIFWSLGFGGPDPHGYWARARELQDHSDDVKERHKRDPSSTWQSGELRFEGGGLIDLLGGRLHDKLKNRDDVRVDNGVVSVGGVAVGKVGSGGEYQSTHPDGVYSGARFDQYGRLMVGGRVLGAFVRSSLGGHDDEKERLGAPADVERAEQEAEVAVREAREADAAKGSGPHPATLRQKVTFLGVIFGGSMAAYSAAFLFAPSGGAATVDDAPPAVTSVSPEIASPPSEDAPPGVEGRPDVPAPSPSEPVRPAAAAPPEGQVAPPTAAGRPPEGQAAEPTAPATEPPGPVRNVTTEVVAGASASSSLSRHPPEHAVDGDDRTAWNEDSPGSGVGDWIELRLRRAVRVAHLRITPGWDLIDRRGNDLFTANRYMTAFDVEHDGGRTSFEVPAGARRFEAALGGVETSRLRIVVRAVQDEPVRYEDLCISEIQIFE